MQVSVYRIALKGVGPKGSALQVVGQPLHADHRAVSAQVDIRHHLVGDIVRNLFLGSRMAVADDLLQGQRDHGEIGLVLDQEVDLLQGEPVAAQKTGKVVFRPPRGMKKYAFPVNIPEDLAVLLR